MWMQPGNGLPGPPPRAGTAQQPARPPPAPCTALRSAGSLPRQALTCVAPLARALLPLAHLLVGGAHDARHGAAGAPRSVRQLHGRVLGVVRLPAGGRWAGRAGGGQWSCCWGLTPSHSCCPLLPVAAATAPRRIQPSRAVRRGRRGSGAPEGEVTHLDEVEPRPRLLAALHALRPRPAGGWGPRSAHQVACLFTAKRGAWPACCQAALACPGLLAIECRSCQGLPTACRLPRMPRNGGVPSGQLAAAPAHMVYRMGRRMSGQPSCASTDESAVSTMEWMIDCASGGRAGRCGVREEACGCASVHCHCH